MMLTTRLLLWGLVMNIKELNQALNILDSRFEVDVREFKPTGFNGLSLKNSLNQYARKITVDLFNPDGRNILLFTLYKERFNESTGSWKLDTRSGNSQWNLETLSFYIKALQVARKFMEEN